MRVPWYRCQQVLQPAVRLDPATPVMTASRIRTPTTVRSRDIQKTCPANVLNARPTAEDCGEWMNGLAVRSLPHKSPPVCLLSLIHSLESHVISAPQCTTSSPFLVDNVALLQKCLPARRRSRQLDQIGLANGGHSNKLPLAPRSTPFSRARLPKSRTPLREWSSAAGEG